MRRLFALVGAYVMALVLLPAAASAQAAPEHTNFRSPVEFSGSNPCSGELVAFKGTISGNITSFADSTGRIHFTAHQLLTAQGQGDSGNHYSFSDTFDTSVTFAPDSAPFVFTQTTVDHVIAQGNAPNFVLHTTNHMTINANGEVTASSFESSAECR